MCLRTAPAKPGLLIIFDLFTKEPTNLDLQKHLNRVWYKFNKLQSNGTLFNYVKLYYFYCSYIFQIYLLTFGRRILLYSLRWVAMFGNRINNFFVDTSVCTPLPRIIRSISVRTHKNGWHFVLGL